MRRGNVKAVVGRTKRSRSVGIALRAHAAVASAHLQAFMAASAAAESSTTDSADRRPRNVGATPEAAEAGPPEARARGPPW